MEKTTVEKKIDIYFINYLFMATVFLLIVASMCVNHVLAYVAFVVFCGGACFFPEKIVVCDLFFLMPFASVMKVSADQMSLFTFCELLVLMVFFIKGNKVTLNILLVCAIYVGYLVFCKLFFHTSDYADIIKQAMNIGLLFYFVRIYPKDEYKTLGMFFIAGMLLSSFVALFADRIPGFYDFVRRIEGGDSKQIEERFTGLNGDPNYYSVNIVLAFSLLFSFYYKKDISKILFWGLFGALSYFGLLTYSKSFLLMFAFICVILLWLTFKTQDALGFGLMLSMGACMIVLALKEGSVVNLTLERLLSANDLSELTTNRSTIWKNYVKYLLGSPKVLLFGDGLALSGANGAGVEGANAHNAYIDVVYRIGFVGTILLVFCFITCFKKSKLKNKTSLNFLGFFTLAITYFFLGMITAYELVFQIFLAYLIYNIDLKKEKEL